MLALMSAMLPIVAVAAASCEDLGMFNLLPPLLREELEQKHRKADDDPGGAGEKSFTRNMDARVLLEHVILGQPLTQIPFAGRTKRAASTRWQYHLKRLNTLNELRTQRATLRAVAEKACRVDASAVYDSERADADGDQPGSVDAAKMVFYQDKLDAMQLLHVPHHVQLRLVKMHATARQEAERKRPWLITQDGELLEYHLGGEATIDIVIDGRSDGAVKRRLRTLRSRLSFTRNALPHIKCDAEAPYLHLNYSKWTTITADCAIPPQAEVDWLKGVARAPASWDLRLDSHSFCMYDEDAGAWMHIGPSEVFELQNVQPDMTIDDVLGHVRRWAQTSPWPAIAHGLAHEKLRIAILPVEALPLRTHVMPTEEPPAFATGARVQYQCRDGRARAATVRAVHSRTKPPKPQRYTIAFDADQRCVSGACLFPSKPPVPSAPADDAAAADASQQQLRCGQRVWYYEAAPAQPEDAVGDAPSVDSCPSCEHAEAPAGMAWAEQCACQPVDSADGDVTEEMDCAFSSCQPCAAQPAPHAPCRARIDAVEADGTYTITLEGTERETTALQLAPLPDASAPPSHSPSPLPEGSSSYPPYPPPLPLDMTMCTSSRTSALTVRRATSGSSASTAGPALTLVYVLFFRKITIFVR